MIATVALCIIAASASTLAVVAVWWKMSMRPPAEERIQKLYDANLSRLEVEQGAWYVDQILGRELANILKFNSRLLPGVDSEFELGDHSESATELESEEEFESEEEGSESEELELEEELEPEELEPESESEEGPSEDVLLAEEDDAGNEVAAAAPVFAESSPEGYS